MTTLWHKRVAPSLWILKVWDNKDESILHYLTTVILKSTIKVALTWSLEWHNAWYRRASGTRSFHRLCSEPSGSVWLESWLPAGCALFSLLLPEDVADAPPDPLTPSSPKDRAVFRLDTRAPSLPSTTAGDPWSAGLFSLDSKDRELPLEWGRLMAASDLADLFEEVMSPVGLERGLELRCWIMKTRLSGWHFRSLGIKYCKEKEKQVQK